MSSNYNTELQSNNLDLLEILNTINELPNTDISEINLQDKTITPSVNEQNITADNGYDGLGNVTVEAIPSNYIDTSDANASANHLLEGNTAYVNGQKITGTIPTTTQATPSIVVDSAGKITASATQTAGYVSEGTKSATEQLTTKAAATITPGTSNQTIAAGTYLTGVQTIAGDVDLKPENIKKGINIFGIDGGYDAVELNFKVIGGTTEPTDPTENTIWVNTNQNIKSWHFGAEEPSTWKLCSTAGEVVGSLGSSTIVKNNSGDAVFTVMSNGTYSIPIMLSDNPGAVAITTQHDGIVHGSGDTGAITINGSIFYYTFPGYDVSWFQSSSPKYLDSIDPIKCLTFLAEKLVPKKDASGMVWISTGTSSPVKFDALKENDIQIYPFSAKVFAGGMWLDAEAKIYQNNTWLAWWNGELYNNGNEYTDITGGWLLTSNGNYNLNTNSQKKADSLYLYVGPSSSAAFITILPIDISRYNTLNFECFDGSSTASDIRAGLISTKNSSNFYNDMAVYGTLKDNGIATIDISSVSGEFYICFAEWSKSGTYQANVRKIWLE